MGLKMYFFPFILYHPVYDIMIYWGKCILTIIPRKLDKSVINEVQTGQYCIFCYFFCYFLLEVFFNASKINDLYICMYRFISTGNVNLAQAL